MPISPTTIFAALAALGAVLGLVLLGARAARATGLGQTGAGRRLVLHETLALDRARRLHLVRCDGRDLLLVTGGGSDIVVNWLPVDGAPLP